VGLWVLQPLTGLLYQPWMIGDGDCGEIGGMKIGRGNWSTQRKPASAPLCPPQIPHDSTRICPGCRGGKLATNCLSYGAAEGVKSNKSSNGSHFFCSCSSRNLSVSTFIDKLYCRSYVVCYDDIKASFLFFRYIPSVISYDMLFQTVDSPVGWLDQWLGLALSKGPNRIGFFPHLRTETDPVPETSCFP
jgi:hypothetical protein